MITPEVYDEVCKEYHAKACIDDEIECGFITIERYKNTTMFREIHYLLDAGESASIALAIEKKLPLIIDEKKGRRFAQRQGIEIIGLVGILRFLYVENRLSREEVVQMVEKLNRSDFRVSKRLMDMILEVP